MAELEGVVGDLQDVSLIAPYAHASTAARLIDCVWFKNGRFMPAVMEIEHSTGILSGLTRMQNLKSLLPAYEGVRWVIVAPDDDRERVVTHCQREQFHDLRARYFPYSAVEELFSLCERRGLSRDRVTDGFLDSFIEAIV